MGIESLSTRTHKVDCRRLTTKQLKEHIKKAKKAKGLYKEAFIEACQAELNRRPVEQEPKPFDINEFIQSQNQTKNKSRSKSTKSNKPGKAKQNKKPNKPSKANKDKKHSKLTSNSKTKNKKRLSKVTS